MQETCFLRHVFMFTTLEVEFLISLLDIITRNECSHLILLLAESYSPHSLLEFFKKLCYGGILNDSFSRILVTKNHFYY